MNRWIVAASWVSFAAITYLILGEAVARWLQRAARRAHALLEREGHPALGARKGGRGHGSCRIVAPASDEREFAPRLPTAGGEVPDDLIRTPRVQHLSWR